MSGNTEHFLMRVLLASRVNQEKLGWVERSETQSISAHQ
jgi:hypothetical protein